MTKGKVLVEQVMTDGTIIESQDTSLSPTEIEAVLCKHFPNLRKGLSSPPHFVGEYNGHKYAIRCKNVTYLGNPHPVYKKRIQISDDLVEFDKVAKSIGAKPLLLGIYTYEDTTIFVDFKIDTYIEKKAHNSSAHIYTSDLSIAVTDGYFQKIDYFKNTITAFRPDLVSTFLDELFNTDAEDEIDYYNIGAPAIIEPETSTSTEDTMSRMLAYAKGFEVSVIPQVQNFFAGVEKNWHGIKCYQTMIEANYKNKYQPEWVGFFLEFCFDKFIKDKHLENLITYHQDKTDGGIDLDLYFPEISCYGDLKAHSEDSRGIQGNDWDTVFSIVNRNDETGHIYYIVCEHATKKDSEYDYEVTKFWNTVQKKADLLSYHKRMKNNVTLKKIYVLDINYDNRKELTVFRQGVNSNGKPRAPKILIEHDKLHHFVIAEFTA